MSIEEMKNVDVRMVKREELTDIREVEINKRKSQEGQIKDYLEQIKKPLLLPIRGIYRQDRI